MSSNAEKLRVYEEQLAAVEAAIAQDPTNDEWLKLKSDLLEVIRLTQQLSEVRGEAAISSAVAAAAAATELKSYAVGDKCQAVFEGDGNWYNAKVVALVEDGYFVEYLGFGNTAQVDFNEVRPYLRPDTSEWRPGAEVQALAVADSRWYPAKLISVGPASAKVRFHGEAETVELELASIRLPTPSGAAGASSSGV
jgi:survival-of-motor-neuron-related-splicing factor 30